MIPEDRLSLFISALFLDFLFKDPDFRLHPVRIIGDSIILLKRVFYKGESKRIKGVLGYLFFAFIWFLIGLFCEKLPFFIKTVVLYFMIAPFQLISEIERIKNSMVAGRVEEARRKLSFLVTRDTSSMKETEIAISSIETLAENLTDAFIAPVFYFLLGGFPALTVYKFTETADSMLGYKIPDLREFGWCFARMDDILNFIPARITFLLIVLSCAFMGGNAKEAFKSAFKYAPLHESVNAGWPESAMAGCLRIRLGGNFVYFGKRVFKIPIGLQFESPNVEEISKAITVSKVTMLFSVILAFLLSLL